MTKTVLKKDKTVNVKMKTGGTYSYKFTTLAQIHKYLEETNQKYYAFTAPIFSRIPFDAAAGVLPHLKGEDYIWIQKLDKDGSPLGDPIRGVKIKWSDNVQEYGGNLTSARRYSLLLAYGLACEDDPAAPNPPASPGPTHRNGLDFEHIRAALAEAKTEDHVKAIKAKVLQQYPKLTEKQKNAIIRMCADREGQLEYGGELPGWQKTKQLGGNK